MSVEPNLLMQLKDSKSCDCSIVSEYDGRTMSSWAVYWDIPGFDNIFIVFGVVQ